MKRCLTFLICMLLCVCVLNAVAEETSAVADTVVTGVWTYDEDLATWFEYTGADVDSKVAYVWEFKEDGTFTQKYADPTKVTEVVKALMTKILTAEIAADGATISAVATDGGFASVDAFVTSIIKQEKLDTLGAEEIIGTYMLDGNTLTMCFTDAEGNAVEAMDTVTIADGVMTLVGTDNETILLTFVEPESVE